MPLKKDNQKDIGNQNVGTKLGKKKKISPESRYNNSVKNKWQSSGQRQREEEQCFMEE